MLTKNVRLIEYTSTMPFIGWSGVANAKQSPLHIKTLTFITMSASAIEENHFKSVCDMYMLRNVKGGAGTSTDFKKSYPIKRRETPKGLLNALAKEYGILDDAVTITGRD